MLHRSLAQPFQNQILTAEDAFKYCQQAMPTIKFHFITKEELVTVRQNLHNRYIQGSTLPGTRSYHVFAPECIGTVRYKITAENDDYAGRYKFFDFYPRQRKSFGVGEYIAAKYDQTWWIGRILEDVIDTAEVLIKFMHPHGPRKTFYWPKRDDIIYLSKADVIAKISPPHVSRLAGCTK